MKRYLYAFLLVFCFAFIPSAAQEDVEDKVEGLMSRMSLDDKIGQLHQIDGRTDLTKVCEMIRRGQVSSIMNIVDASVIDSLQRIAVEESPSGIPILFARDIVHGFKTILPIPLGQAASFDDALIRSAARNTALEATEIGIKWAFAPMMDIARDPRWGRIAEGFGEDPYLASRLAVSVVKGYQGDSLSDELSMAACAKHFVAYGAAEGGRDYNTTYVPVRSLYDTYFPPFKACVEAGVASFMSSFNDNDGVPATGNSWLLSEVLRNEWGFTGMVVSDWGSVGGLIPHGVAKDKKEAAKICLEAGCDMDMMSYSYLNHLKELLAEGSVSMEVLDEAVRRVLRLKVKLGLIEKPYTRKTSESVIYSDELLQTACRLAEESSVLLKNEGILPLDEKIKTVLVTGPMADAAYDQMGTWALDGDKAHTITPVEAIRGNLPPDVKLIYANSLDYPRDKSSDGFKALKKAARKADVLIAFVGEEQMMSGEAHSLSNLHLQGQQSEMLEALASTGKPLVTVFMAGRPLVIASEMELSDAVLYMWHPGTMGGQAAYNLLWGKANPSGKLPVTFPRNEGQIPVYYNHKHTSHIAKGTEGNLDKVPREMPQSVMGHTSSYLDVSPTPLLPFGFGLSYTTFELSNLRVETPEVRASDSLVFYVDVKNTGEREGCELVQAYVGRKSASTTRPMKELKAYERVSLKAGESRTVRLEIPAESLAFCRKDLSWGTEPGNYILTVGTSSEGGMMLYFELNN
ncbi:MAG: glycoside hydrolase family 3 N-terminal domain-containing protein [Candidatus Cryptobacteroides sp.]